MSKFRFKVAVENEGEVLDNQETGLDDIHDLDLDAAVEEMVTELQSVEEMTQRGLDIAQSNTDIAAVLSTGEGDEITPIETSLLQVSANLAASGFEDDAAEFVAATESFMSRNAAIEASQAKAAGILKTVVTGIISGIQKFIGLYTFFIETAKRLRNKVIKAQDHVKSLGSKVSITATRSKMLLHDKNQVITNFKELKSETQRAADFYTKSMEIASDSLKDSKFANIKSIISFASDDNLISILDNLEKTTKDLISAGKMSILNKGDIFVSYVNSPFMGNSAWSVVTPKSTGTSMAARTGSAFDFMGSHNVQEISRSSVGGLKMGALPTDAGFQEEVSKNDLLGLLDNLMDSTKGLGVYTNLNAKFGHYLSMLDVSKWISTVGGTNIIGVIVPGLLMKTVRALRSLMFINIGLLSTMFYKYKRTVSYVTDVAMSAR